MGEFWAKQELNKLSPKKYIIINDVMIYGKDNKTHQIDHIVVSKYGIFVIEMKNYYGKIVGDEYNKKWIQYLGRNKYYFNNPIHQNFGHIKVLEELLDIKSEKIIPIICFSNQASLKIKAKSPIVQLDNLNKLIRNFTKEIISEPLDIITNKITESNIITKDIRKNHIKNIKIQLKEEKHLEKNGICPKCHNCLIPKKGKYGTFIGYSNYPQCKYIKKLKKS